MAKQRKPRLGRGLSSLMSTPVSIQPPPEAPPPPPEEGQDQPADASPSPATGNVESHPSGRHSEGAMPADTSGDGAPGPADGLRYVSVEGIRPNPHQPRRAFDEGALARLATSIRQDGLMQPIVVRPAEEGRYDLVAGERRWRAARQAGLDQVPAIVRDLSDRQLAEWALIENLQREDLNPIERAQAFRGLVEQFGLSHEQVAERVGRERSTISNLLRLLELDEGVQELVRLGQLSGGHARALLGLSDDAAQRQLARRAVAGGWSVRMTEAAVRRSVEGRSAKEGGGDDGRSGSAHLSDLEEQIGNQLQTKVRLKRGRKKGSGSITIAFYSLDEFDRLMEKLGVEVG